MIINLLNISWRIRASVFFQPTGVEFESDILLRQRLRLEVVQIIIIRHLVGERESVVRTVVSVQRLSDGLAIVRC